MNKIIVNSLLTLLTISLITSTIHTCVKNYSIEKKYVTNISNKTEKENELKYIYQLMTLKNDKKCNNFLNNFLNHKTTSVDYNYKKMLSDNIKNLLLDQYFQKNHFLLGPHFIRKKIRSLKFFKKNNKFNQNKFDYFLNMFHISKKEYETFVNVQESKKKFFSILKKTDFLTNLELKLLKKPFSERRIISKAKINIVNNFNKKKFTSEEISDYFNKNKLSFFYPEKLKISYIKLDKNKLKISVNNNDYIRWCIKHHKNYIISEKRKFSIIKTHSKQKAKNLLKLLLLGKNFENLAKKRKKILNYIPVTKENQTHWISTTSFPIEIKNAHLLKKGDVSKIICSKKGFFIFKLENVLIEKKQKKLFLTKPFLPIVIKDKQSKYFNKIRKKIHQRIKNKNYDLKFIANENKLKIFHTKLFSVKKELANLLFNNVHTNSLLSIYDKNLHTKNIKNKIYYLFKIEKHIPKKQKTVSECKQEIINILNFQEAQKQTIKNLKNIIDTKNNNELKKLFDQKFHFSKKHVLSPLDISPIQKFLFNLKIEQKNGPVYGVFINQNKKIFLVECYDKFFSNSLNKENILLIENYIKNYNSDIVIYNIIHNLEKKCDIKNNNKLSDNII